MFLIAYVYISFDVYEIMKLVMYNVVVDTEVDMLESIDLDMFLTHKHAFYKQLNRQYIDGV